MSITVPLYGFGGGGAALNFKVVPGLTQPSTVSENAIWVKTEKIGAWYFSAALPEGMQEWDVWFPTGTSSPIEFNALKKNGITVYPMSAKQYVSGVLVDVTAKSYHGGAWVDWYPAGAMYYEGYQNEAVTGGWIVNAQSGATVTFADNKIGITAGGDNGSFVVRTSNKVDLSGFSNLICEGYFDSHYTGSEYPFVFGLTKNVKSPPLVPGSLEVASVRTTQASGAFTLTVPLGGVSSACYITFGGYYLTGRVTKIYAK